MFQMRSPLSPLFSATRRFCSDPGLVKFRILVGQDFGSDRDRDGGYDWKVRMRKRVLHGARILLASVLMWANLVPLCAQAGDRTIGQFVHTAWSAKDGLPAVYALAQATDGFLWLGTMQGLYRFDGISFERYEPRSGPAFQSSNVTALLALPNGDLWIGYRDRGVSRLRDGGNTNFTNADGLPSGRVTRLVANREGVIWAATDGVWSVSNTIDGGDSGMIGVIRAAKR